MAELSIIITGSLQQVVATTGMTLTGDIADGTTGGTVDAHLTLGGDITYPVAITGLPSWINDPGSIASGTDVHLTGTYPATAGTETFTVTATDSTTPTAQTASDAQSVVVSAAAAAIEYVGETHWTGYKPHPTGLTLPAGTKAGDLAVICCSAYVNYYPSVSGSVDLLAPISLANQTTNHSAEVLGYFVTAADVANGYIACTYSATNRNAVSMSVWRGVNTTTPLHDSSWNNPDVRQVNSPVTGTGITTASGGALIWFGLCGSNVSVTINTPSEYTLLAQGTGAYSCLSTAYRTNADGSATGDVTTSSNGNIYPACWFGCLNPA